ncbi:MAG: hypothetical protein LKF48_09715 [Prevotella sp.]|jgi:predicted DNA-binding protein|nr:hypothetical protein [Prevotella sp.]MCH4183417.1 hypothetical protein [Prevotella sp.]
MGRPKKESQVLNIRLADDVYENLCKYSDDTGQTKTLAVERILSKAFREYFSLPENKRIPIK